MDIKEIIKTSTENRNLRLIEERLCLEEIIKAAAEEGEFHCYRFLPFDADDLVAFAQEMGFQARTTNEAVEVRWDDATDLTVE